MLRGKEERVGDDAVLAALDEIDLLGLLLDRHIFMNDADAALARDGDRHARFGHGVHGRAHDGDAETDLLREMRFELHIARNDGALRRNEQHVVKGEPFADETVGISTVQDHILLFFRSYSARGFRVFCPS